MKLPNLNKRRSLFIGAVLFAIITGFTGILPAAWAAIILFIAGIASGILNRRKIGNTFFLLASLGLAIATSAMAILPIAGTAFQPVFAYLSLFTVPAAITLLGIIIYKALL